MVSLYNKQSFKKLYQPYLDLIRFKRQIGTYLLFLPCAWSTGIASSLGTAPDWNILALFATGSFFMRNAGCIINDIADRKIDILVERTKKRPLVTKKLNLKQSLSFLGLNLFMALLILLQFNNQTIYLSLLSIPLVILYPFMKRYTYWPQAFLGLTFNYGALLGNLAVTNIFDFNVSAGLYISGIFYTLIYDTIYALQDVKDDKKNGIKSTAIYLEKNIKSYLYLFVFLIEISLIGTGYFAKMGIIYYTASVLGSSLILLSQIYFLTLNCVKSSQKHFLLSKWAGVLIFIGIMIDKLNLLK